VSVGVKEQANQKCVSVSISVSVSMDSRKVEIDYMHEVGAIEGNSLFVCLFV
jgi:hypothetical protein